MTYVVGGSMTYGFIIVAYGLFEYALGLWIGKRIGEKRKQDT